MILTQNREWGKKRDEGKLIQVCYLFRFKILLSLLSISSSFIHFRILVRIQRIFKVWVT